MNSYATQAEDGGWTWFVQDTHWSRAGLPMAIMLLLLAPLLRSKLGRVPFLVYMQLPLYMLHQYEEHAHGAFKREVNAGLLPLPGAKELTHGDIFVINIVGVWGLDTCILYLADKIDPALGLAAPHLAVVNGVSHIVQALRTRRYNPGLWTSLLLFLPISGASIYAITRETGASRRTQARGLGIALVAHALTGLFIVARGRGRAATGA